MKNWHNRIFFNIHNGKEKEICQMIFSKWIKFVLVHRGVTNFEAFLFLNQILNDLNRIITRNIFIFIIIIILISHSLSLSAAFQEIVMNDALFYRYFWRPFQFHYYLGVVCTTTYKKKDCFIIAPSSSLWRSLFSSCMWCDVTSVDHIPWKYFSYFKKLPIYFHSQMVFCIYTTMQSRGKISKKISF